MIARWLMGWFAPISFSFPGRATGSLEVTQFLAGNVCLGKARRSKAMVGTCSQVWTL